MTRSYHSQRGIVLAECLVYCALFFIVMGLAYGAYYRCLDNSRRLQRNTSDITLALDAGERWRDDVRLTQGFAVLTNSCVLTQAAGTVEYCFADNAVWRRTRTGSVRLMKHVKNSAIYRDEYRQVTALRWELELETTRPNARVKPLFTFKAPVSRP